MRIVVEPEDLMSIDGIEGVALLRLADIFLSEEERGKVVLSHSNGEIEAPASTSMMGTAKRYKDGTRLKIKGREFKISCATLLLTNEGGWKLEACINPIEQKQGCHCMLVFPFNFG